MLVIRDAQLQVLGADARLQFEARLRDIFLEAYPRECRQAGGPGAVLRWVRSGLRAAAAAGYRGRGQASRWLALMLILGVDFATDPQLPWVRQALEPADERDPSERLDGLYAQTLDYLEETAGEDAERVVRALLRMRAVDFTAVPALEAAAAVDDACGRLQALYPQKFEHQGAALTAAAVAQQFERARQAGLPAGGGSFLFVLLCFMLGNGFDHDLLHGWAAQALQADEPAERAARLEAAARAHLAASLRAD